MFEALFDVHSLSSIHAVFLLVLGFVFMWFSSRSVIANSTILAEKLHVSTFLIGSIFAALLASFPEFIITISSLLQDAPDVSLGNLFGSNLSNMSLTLVLPLLFCKKLEVNSHEQESLMFMIFVSVLAMLSATVAAWPLKILAPLLIVAYFAVVGGLIKFNRLPKAPEHIPGTHEHHVHHAAKHAFTPLLGKLMLSVGAATVAGNLIVLGSKILNAKTGFGLSAIGALVLSQASTLPESFVNIAAVKSNIPNFAFGNSIGTLLGQSLLILGILCAFGHSVHNTTMLYSVPWVSVISFVLCYSLYINKGITRTTGLVLTLLYGGFLLHTLKLGLLTS